MSQLKSFISSISGTQCDVSVSKAVAGNKLAALVVESAQMEVPSKVTVRNVASDEERALLMKAEAKRLSRV